ncbi:MAG: PEP-CTERM sorting domain-containing protein [Pirellulales bacterium]
MKRFWKTSLVCAAVALSSLVVRDASAHVIYFSQTGPSDIVLSDPGDEFSPTVVNGGLAEDTVPQISMNVGESRQLHVWMNFDGTASPSPSARRSMTALGLDIVSNAAGLSANSFELWNPENLDAGLLRWNGTTGGSLNPDASTLVFNSRAVSLVGSAGIGSHPTLYDLDGLHDDTTGGALLGTLDFSALAPGTYGLYFRTGLATTLFSPATTGHPLQYGNTAGPIYQGDDIGNGDQFDAGLTLADAIIVVQGGTTRDLVVIGGDPSGAIDVPFPGRLSPVDTPIGGPAGKLNIDSQFQVDSFFDVFFDITTDDMDGVLAMLGDQGMTVIPGVTLDTRPSPTTYDFGLHIPGNPGENLVLDVDFSGVPNTTVNSVGVPEPSSFVLAALGCVAIVGLRRRKSA